MGSMYLNGGGGGGDGRGLGDNIEERKEQETGRKMVRVHSLYCTGSNNNNNNNRTNKTNYRMDEQWST